mmetsp:Transcript_88968/g.185914  ORF Transcript_88968/g.185914 Transcript_88968/m.185914 type:complete len:224 (-) Transcript_88968:302-973(-)
MGARPMSFLTRENLNVWRVGDYVRNGFLPVACFRHRKHTFPVSDAVGSPTWDDLVDNMHSSNDFRYSTLCRSCFYFMMFYAPRIGSRDNPIADRAVLAALRVTLTAPEIALVQMVAAHTLFWYVILRSATVHAYHLPIISYDMVVRSSANELSSHLKEQLPPGLDSDLVIQHLLKSRKEVTWLERREERYEETPGYEEAERLVKDMITAIRTVDTVTDLSVLE